MLEILLGIANSGAFGGVLGAIAGIFQAKEETKKAVINNDHEYRMTQLDYTEAQNERQHSMNMVDKQIDLAQTEGGIEQEIEETKGWRDSYNMVFKTRIEWINGVKALVRPVITSYLLVIATYFAYNVSTLVGGMKALPPADTLALYVMIIEQLFFLTNMSVSWWFGSRGVSKK